MTEELQETIEAPGPLPEPEPLAEDTRERARLCVEAALDRKGENPVALDVHGLTSFADAFVIVSGRSDRQVRAVADSIVQALKKSGHPPLGVEGVDEGHWVLIDAGDVIVHVFDPEARERYDLERLWSDAPAIEVPSAEGHEAATSAL